MHKVKKKFNKNYSKYSSKFIGIRFVQHRKNCYVCVLDWVYLLRIKDKWSSIRSAEENPITYIIKHINVVLHHIESYRIILSSNKTKRLDYDDYKLLVKNVLAMLANKY